MKRVRLVLSIAVLICGCADRSNKQAPLTAASITLNPSSGEGQGAVFAVHLAPADAVRLVGVLFNEKLDGAGACYTFYNPTTDVFTLVKDSGVGVEAGTAGKSPLENSQCTLSDAANTRAKIENNVLALNIPITFKKAFAGPKNAYVYVEYQDGRNTTFKQAGTWLVAP